MTDEYDIERKNSFDNVKAKFDEAFAELKKHKEEWVDWPLEGYEENYKANMLYNLLTEHECKLNHFTYDDVTYRCGDRDGSCSGLLTPLSEWEVKEKMKEYAEKCVTSSQSYCHHKFLNSISDFGIYYQSESSHEYYGTMVAYEISLNGITEKDILSPQKYSEIIKAREEAARLKREAEEAARKARIEQQERAQYEQLKKKYGQ